jgi:hypothetical protein
MDHYHQGECLFPEIESRLRHLAEPLGEPEEGDWLAEHPEPGQTFEQYLAANPVRREDTLTTIHRCTPALSACGNCAGTSRSSR